MSESFRAVRIADRVHWVGAIDWNLRNFHGYRTGRGSTYNAYLITGDVTVLVDTVKKPFFDEMLARVRSVIGDRSVECVISNHAEMDHSGALPKVVDALKPGKVYASRMGVKALRDHLGSGLALTEVKDGEELRLGDLDLVFLETRMLHWPDSMVTYFPADRVLFTQDGFGMHLASSERFADELPDSVLEHEGAKYFANILLPYAPLVSRLIDRMKDLNLTIDVLAPDHGPIWRKDIGRMPALWGQWAKQKPTEKAVLVYDSMWGSTEAMAKAIAEGLVHGGVSARVMSLESSHRSDVAAELLDAAALFAGSSTLNNNLLPLMADVMTYLRGLKPKNKLGAAFGSFGWSGEGARQAHEMLSAMGMEILADPITVRYVPQPEDLEKCREFGGEAAARIKTFVKETE